MSMIRKFTLITAVAVGLSIATTAAADTKIAVVDLQRAINQTEDGRKAKARLKKLFDARQKTLDDRQNRLKKMKSELESKRDVLSRDALQSKLEAYQKEFVELQSKYVDYQRELASKEGDLTKKIVARMEQILKSIGKQRGYTMIVERGEGGVIYVPAKLDLTEELIKRYNKGEGRTATRSKKN